MYTSLAPLIGWMATLVVCALAWVKGGAPERIGGIIVFVSSVAALLIQLFLPGPKQSIPLLLGEGLIGFGFLILALRYASPWLGGAMLLQAIQFSLHAYYLVGEVPHDRTYAIVNNLDSLGVLICILIGTVQAWRRAPPRGAVTPTAK